MQLVSPSKIKIFFRDLFCNVSLSDKRNRAVSGMQTSLNPIKTRTEMLMRMPRKYRKKVAYISYKP